MEIGADEALVQASTVRVSGPVRAGAGWFVGPNHLVTCTHVVEHGVNPDQVEVSLGDAGVRPSRIWRAPTDDVSLLEGPFASRHYLPLGLELTLGDVLFTFGYPESYPDGDSITTQYEGPTRGRVPLLKLKGGQIEPGYSGGPLFNLRTRRVCGMVVATRDRRAALGGRAIPGEAILRQLAAAIASGMTRVRHIDGREILRSRLAIQRDEVLSRHVVGSDRLTVRDLTMLNSLLQPFRVRSANRELSQASDLLSILGYRRAPAEPSAKSRRNKRILLLAQPGSGKSTFALVSFIALAERRALDDDAPIPILVDLRDYRILADDPSFASGEWIDRRAHEIAGTSPLASEGVQSDIAPTLDPVLLVDSLDEFLAGKSAEEARRVASAELFQRASVLCCRTQYFDRYLSPGVFPTHDIVEVRPFREPDLQRYVNGYCRAVFASNWRQQALSFFERLEASAQLRTLCLVPLRLNMALDLLTRDETDTVAPPTDDLLGLYQAYVVRLLAIEAERVGSVLNPEQKRQALEYVAFTFYDEGNMGSSVAPPFISSEFEQIIAAIPFGIPAPPPVHALVEDVRSHSLLHVDGAAYASVEPGTLSFTHKSFQEYFVASYLFHALLTEVPRATEAFQRHVSPEVSEFLKEYIGRLRSDARLRKRLGQALRQAYAFSREEPAAVSDERSRARIAREQLGYYLGNLPDADVQRFLRAEAAAETDPWVRRGIIIGLSFGGDATLLEGYIDRLSEERRDPSGGTSENDVNLGFHLSFFGDQPFDVLRPDVDQGLPTCSRTVARLIYQLQTETDRGSWRLNLYTLCDLFEHRRISRGDFSTAAAAHSPQLRRLLSRLSTDSRTNVWPELARLSAILDVLPRATPRDTRRTQTC